MDTDDCEESTKEQYINGNLFDDYVLKDYVVPIYTIPDMEHPLYDCGIIPKIFSKKEKVAGYKKVFEIPKLPYNKTKSDELREISNKLKKSQKTNLDLFLDYCIEQADKRKI